jgi:alpha-tubulin suppressor-like RCC1 family protein
MEASSNAHEELNKASSSVNGGETDKENDLKEREDEVFGWGQAAALGVETDSSSIVCLSKLSGKQIVNVASKKHSLFLTDAGAVLSCGANEVCCSFGGKECRLCFLEVFPND